MTDTDITNVTPFDKSRALVEGSGLRPSPHKGEGPARRSGKDPTGAIRARRFRRKRKAPAVTAPVTLAVTRPEIQSFENANDFNASVTVERHADVQLHRDGGKANAAKSVTPFVQPEWQVGHDTVAEDTRVGEHRTGATDALAYTAAVALAGCAAWFSIRGMAVLFPGAPVAIVIMASAMEAAKLVTAGWLARRWRSTTWVWRFALMTFVFGLAIINGVGVFSQLVAAHVGERGAATAAVEIRDAEIVSRIEVAQHAVADLDARVSQIDTAIGEATKRGRTTGAMTIMEGQRRARAGLVDERNREAGTLAALKTERAGVAARGRQAETEAAPIRYAAAVFGVNDSEEAIRWLIALMVLCCDPLAIALTAAASARRSEARRDEQIEVEIVHSTR